MYNHMPSQPVSFLLLNEYGSHPSYTADTPVSFWIYPLVHINKSSLIVHTLNTESVYLEMNIV